MTFEQFSNRYEMDDSASNRLGSGGFGHVYKAWDNIENVHVAIKVAKVKNLKSELTLQNEVEVAKKIPRHGNIMFYQECIRFRKDDGYFDYAVMKFYGDGNLNLFLDGNPHLSLEKKKEIAVGIIKGIDHIHNHKIIHRDLKPSNILIANEKKCIPVITDFGLAKLAMNDKAIKSNIKGGSLSFTSPEQLQGHELQQNSDLWSLGVILYKLFIGHLPFLLPQGNKRSAEQIIGFIKKKKSIEGLEKIPKPFGEIVKKCLVVDPMKRLMKTSQLLEILGPLAVVRNSGFRPVSVDLPFTEEDEITLLFESDIVKEPEKPKFNLAIYADKAKNFIEANKKQVGLSLSVLGLGLLTMLFFPSDEGDGATDSIVEKKNIDVDDDGIIDFHETSIDAKSSPIYKRLNELIAKVLVHSSTTEIKLNNLENNKEELTRMFDPDAMIILDDLIFEDGIHGVLSSCITNDKEKLTIREIHMPDAQSISHIVFSSRINNE